MQHEHYLSALEHFDDFLEAPIVEVTDSGKSYPVGRSECNGELIHFMHYTTFHNALRKWDERKQRIDKDNMAIMFTDWKGLAGGGKLSDLERFEKLNFKNKILFTDIEYPDFKCTFYLKGLRKANGGIHQIYDTQNFINGKRYIDQFDYINFFNNLRGD